MAEDEAAAAGCTEEAQQGLGAEVGDGVIELRRPSPFDEEEDEGPQWGGGIEGLTVKFGLLVAELENTREGCHKLACESEEIVQAIFERIGILHCRTSRIETALGLPPWEPPSSPSGEGAQSPRSPRARDADAPEGEGQEKGPARCQCLRGHPLEPDEEAREGPPQQCGFCKCRRQTAFQCSEGCYFHACQECVLGGGAESAEGCAKPDGEAEPDVKEEKCDEKSDCPTKTPEEGAERSRSPSNASEEDAARCASAMEGAASSGSRPASGRSRPMTPSTTLPEDCAETSSRGDVDSPYGLPEGMTWLPGAEAEAAAQDSEPSRPPRIPKEGGTNGLKARLFALEAEVRELAAATASTASAMSPSGADAAALKEAAAAAAQAAAEASCAALREEVEASFARLKQREKDTSDSCSEAALRKEVGRCEDAFKKQLAACTEALQKEVTTSAEAMRRLIVESQEASDRLLTDKVGDSQVKVRAELACWAGELRQELAETSTVTAGTGEDSVLHETVEGLQLRLDALEGDLPRGRVRASRGVAMATANRSPASPTAGADADLQEGPALQGLARGLTALARSLGLARSGEQVGCSDWGWDEVGSRIEEAWATRAKEVWHLGLPPRPDLFDFLQGQAARPASAAPPATTAGVPRLPDRREAARLANRLASTSPSPTTSAGMSPRGGGYGEATDAESSPMRRSTSSAGGLGAGPKAALPLPSRTMRPRGVKGRDMAEAWGESSDTPSFSQPTGGRATQRAPSSGASQRLSGSGRLPPKSESPDA